jgi:hypothetical protein
MKLLISFLISISLFGQNIPSCTSTNPCVVFDASQSLEGVLPYFPVAHLGSNLIYTPPTVPNNTGILSCSIPQLSFPTVASNKIYNQNAPSTFTISCAVADIFRNGILQTENGVDYTLTGLSITFNSNIIQSTDIIKIIYRCTI